MFLLHYTKLSMMIWNKVEIKSTKSRINSLLPSRRVYMSSLSNFPLLTAYININFASPGMIGNMDKNFGYLQYLQCNIYLL